jgi:general stress protein 26
MGSSLSESDKTFLSGPRLGFLTTTPLRADAFPAPRPVWFEVTDSGTIELFSLASSPKVPSVEAAPRVSLVAANNPGEREHWVSVIGSATVDPEGAADLATRLADRYWDLSDPERKASLDGMLAVDLVKIVIEPEKVQRYG